MRIAEVAVNVPVSTTYDYLIPGNLNIAPGDFVQVPVGPRSCEGVVIKIKSEGSEHQLKSVKRKLHNIPPLSIQSLEIGDILRGVFYNTPGPSYFALKPAGRGKSFKTVFFVTSKEPSYLATRADFPELKMVYDHIKEKGSTTKRGIKLALKNPKRLEYAINWLRKSGYIKKKEEDIQGNKKVTKTLYIRGGVEKFESIDEPFKELQCFLFRYGFWCPFKDVRKRFSVKKADLKQLEKEGLVEFEYFTDAVDTYISPGMGGYSEKVLNPHQEAARKAIFAKLKSKKWATHLITGVTGSGKTEVYINAAAETLKMGKRVMILVPEISLTPQVAAQFKSRFGHKVMVYHSKQTAAEKRTIYSGVLNDKYDIVIGPRSVLFLPMKDLGLIVMDEFQDDSFKQHANAPYYDGLTLAEEICKRRQALLLLASATPPVAFFHGIQQKGKGHHELPERAVTDSVLPEIDLVNMALEADSILSVDMKRSIKMTLEKGDQIMLFFNRRGFFRNARCKKCGYIFKCKSCDVPLVYHSDSNRMTCHYCASETGVPKVCPDCGSRKIDYRGMGIQRIEELIKGLFPDAAIARLDQDISKNIVRMQDTLSKFRSGDIDILIGTQLIAKGMDFANVTLVGVLSAEVLFSYPDYSTAERGFSLLMQVSGRSGRGAKKGKVIVQTYDPNNELIKFSLDHDYKGFYDYEIKLRKRLGFPPFMRMYKAVFSAKNEKTAEKAASKAAELLSKYKEIKVYGPIEAVLKKINNIYFYELLIKAPLGDEPNEAITDLRNSNASAKIFRLG